MYNAQQRIAKFKVMYSKSDLLEVLNVDNSFYDYLIHKKKNLYSSFYIDKKNGGKRLIQAPCQQLKRIQSDLNIIIQKNYEFNKEIIHGFIEGNSIKTNADIHKNSRYILNIDLKDFFDSIHFGRVRGMFMNEPFNFSNYIATNLAKVLCHDKKLPQGSPTSPTLSNIICYRLDRELNHFCQKYKCKYSRYADDITISSNRVYFPKDIAIVDKNLNVVLGKKIVEIIKAEGFNINNNKVNFSSMKERQEVTGLIVNKKINVKKVYVKNLRAILNNIEKNGFYEEGYKFLQNRENLEGCSEDYIIQKIKNIIIGKINFLKMVKGEQDRVYIKYATQFNTLIGYEYFDVDYGKDLITFIENRTFPILSYDELTQGTCFFTHQLGLISSTHVFTNGEAYFDKSSYDKAVKEKNYKFLNENRKVFYLLDHLNKKFLFKPNVVENNVATDFYNDYNSHTKKEFNINMEYIPKKGEMVYISGYGEFNGYNNTSINFIPAKVTGTSTFLKRKFFNISEKLYHGMSGGPVLNENREVIGIVYVGLNVGEHHSGIMAKSNGFILLNDIVK